MTYELEFDPRALKEWQKLGETVKKQFRKKLVDVLSNPRVESARLRELPDCYKIKLKTSGYRLVYQVQDDVVLVVVIAIGKREKSAVYRQTDKRL
ncbi:type II toxin-antitoxin system RelE/ParE family toxin [Salmonella enterica]|nr:type II toxin-antitoxin system RelE/ParE family toxin [Salmonella enterica]EKO0999547.1 type II toxin-antitoxin system RelE/ParE family toxin [Salmonella enterica subsp. enterica]ELS3678764.1 type II toxin-antitoxin system RelE/ParE family toxin [Salmonella enterica]